jgi:hypothetical protein
LCGEATRPFHTQVGRRLYHHCPSCGFILLDKAHRPTLEQQRERYRLHQNGPDHPGYVAMFREFLAKCVTPFAAPGCRALDLGCGPGPVLAGLLKEVGHPTEVYDPIFFPKKSEGAFGLVTCTEVLEHLEDPVEALKPWVKRLERGGHLSQGPQAEGQALVVPSQGADQAGGTTVGSAILAGMTLFHPEDPVKFGEWFYPRDITHVSFYTPRTLEVLAKALGLSLIYTDRVRCFVMKAWSSPDLVDNLV